MHIKLGHIYSSTFEGKGCKCWCNKCCLTSHSRAVGLVVATVVALEPNVIKMSSTAYLYTGTNEYKVFSV